MDLTAFQQALAYDPATGVFTWRIRPSGRARAGAPAGGLTSEGYLIIGYRGAHVLAHRLAWAFHTGRMPVGVMDHINGIRTDNRISNLREVSPAENRGAAHKARSDAKGAMFHCGVRYTGAGAAPWLIKHQRDGKTVCRSAPDLLSAVALKLRLQRGGELPPKGNTLAGKQRRCFAP